MNKLRAFFREVREVVRGAFQQIRGWGTSLARHLRQYGQTYMYLLLTVALTLGLALQRIEINEAEKEAKVTRRIAQKVGEVAEQNRCLIRKIDRTNRRSLVLLERHRAREESLSLVTYDLIVTIAERFGADTSDLPRPRGTISIEPRRLPPISANGCH